MVGSIEEALSLSAETCLPECYLEQQWSILHIWSWRYCWGLPNPAGMFMAATWNWYTMFSFRLLICNMDSITETDGFRFVSTLHLFSMRWHTLGWSPVSHYTPSGNLLVNGGETWDLLLGIRTGQGIGISVLWLCCIKWQRRRYVSYVIKITNQLVFRS